MSKIAQTRQGARHRELPATALRTAVSVAAGLLAGLLVLVPSPAAAQTASKAEQALLGKKEVVAPAPVLQASADSRIPAGERALLGRKVRSDSPQTPSSLRRGELTRPDVDGEQALLGRKGQVRPGNQPRT